MVKVQEAKEEYKPKVLLGGWPPPRNLTEEQTLPRQARCKISQLRSSYSTLVNSYLSRIQEETIDKCPDCKKSPHDVPHIFNCTENPTNLTVEDLWKAPAKVANWLKLF